jgi:hypothetical protein
MMAAGNVPDGLPQPNPSPSYWQLQQPYSKANHRSTPELPTEGVVNYVIISSGISGAATAWKLLAGNEAGKVVMLEARTAASGGSTRGGAHCHAGWWVKFKENVQKYGEEEAVKIDDMEERSMMDLEYFIKYYYVECDYQEMEAVDALKGSDQAEEIEDLLRLRHEALARGGIQNRRPRIMRREDDAEKHLGTTVGKGVTVSYRTFTVNPYLLNCRLLDKALAEKVTHPLNLQTNTPVHAIRAAAPSKNDGARWEVETSRGTVRAKNVILATDGYTNALSSEIASTRFLNPSVDISVALRHTTGWTVRPFAMNGHGAAVAFGCANALVNIIQRRKQLQWVPRSFRIVRAWRGQAEDGYATEPDPPENDGMRGLYDE